MQSLTPLLQLIDHSNSASIENLVHNMELWPDMIVMVHNFNTQFTDASKQVKNVLGYDITCWDNDFLSAVTHPDDIFGINEKMSGYLMEVNNPSYDKAWPHVIKLSGRMRCVTGAYKMVEFSGVILQYNSKGGFQLGLGVYQDVSARKSERESLKKASIQLTRKIEDHLTEIKRLYAEMFPYEQSDHVQINTTGVPRIHIVNLEQLAAKVKYEIEIHKILSKQTPGSQLLAGIGKFSLDDLPFTTKALQCIEQQLGDPEFTIDKFAHEMNMSRGHLYRKILHAFNVSPAELIKRMRLERAAFLLQTSHESITSVAFSVGFTDSSYFSKCFRSIYGTTPLEFRKSEHQTVNENGYGVA
jgi:AraC-like DNA-binding protein